MATDFPTPPTDIELLHEFLGKRLQRGRSEATLEEALAEFHEYKRQLDDIKSRLVAAEKDVAAGRIAPFDADVTKSVVRERLAREGITD
jgi:hypothetical protein